YDSHTIPILFLGEYVTETFPRPPGRVNLQVHGWSTGEEFEVRGGKRYRGASVAGHIMDDYPIVTAHELAHAVGCLPHKPGTLMAGTPNAMTWRVTDSQIEDAQKCARRLP